MLLLKRFFFLVQVNLLPCINLYVKCVAIQQSMTITQTMKVNLVVCC